MHAAWDERVGPATEVLVVREMPTPEPGPGEVRIRLEGASTVIKVPPDGPGPVRWWGGVPSAGQSWEASCDGQRHANRGQHDAE
jgi:hypothetical protein